MAKQDDAYFMELAIKQAELALSKGQMPFGAVVVDKNGSLVAEGHNVVRAELDPTAHGEIVAIRNAWRKLGEWGLLFDCEIYTSCEPCLLCTWVITQAGFRRVVFAARGSDLPVYRPLLASDLIKAASWINAQPDWKRLDVLGDFMREKALASIRSFPWETVAELYHQGSRNLLPVKSSGQPH